MSDSSSFVYINENNQLQKISSSNFTFYTDGFTRMGDTTTNDVYWTKGLTFQSNINKKIFENNKLVLNWNGTSSAFKINCSDVTTNQYGCTLNNIKTHISIDFNKNTSKVFQDQFTSPVHDRFIVQENNLSVVPNSTTHLDPVFKVDGALLCNTPNSIFFKYFITNEKKVNMTLKILDKIGPVGQYQSTSLKAPVLTNYIQMSFTYNTTIDTTDFSEENFRAKISTILGISQKFIKNVTLSQ